MGARYRKAVTELRESLANQSAQHEAVEILRSLIDQIVLRPDAEEVTGFVMDIEGDLAGILSLCRISKKAAGLSPDDLMQIKLVAGVGFEPTTFRL
jgi:site-specific DNA recombinase